MEAGFSQIQSYYIKLEVSIATTYRSKCKSKDKCSQAISRYCPHFQAISRYVTRHGKNSLIYTLNLT